MQGSASADLGPILPALCGGLSAALMLLIADAAVGAVAGVLAVVLMVSIPGWLSLHAQSLTGPPLLAMTLLMVGAMVHAPRFSLWYGTLAAVAGLFVATEGAGLPLAAAAWAFIQRARESGRWQRVLIAIVPAGVVLLLMRMMGGAWPHDVTFAWRGGLDRGLRAAGTIIGNQMAPRVDNAALRFLVIADLALIILAVIVVGWRRVGREGEGGSIRHRIYPVAGLVVLALVTGLALRTLFVVNMPEPDLAAVMPIAVMTLLVLVVSIVGLWPRWPTWGKAIAAVLVTGWWQAAIR